MSKCTWVLRPASPGVDAIYCGRPTPYRYVKDDDGNKVRKHNTLCNEHHARDRELKQQAEQEEDDD